MNTRRLVGIDLGIATAHTVRVLDGQGATVAKRRAWPTVESLAAVEAAALAGCPDGTRLEVVIEPTGPAWLPIAVFFFRPRPYGVPGFLAEGRGPAPVLVPVRQVQRHRRGHLGPAAAVRPGRAGPAGAARRRPGRAGPGGSAPPAGSPGRAPSTRSGSQPGVGDHRRPRPADLRVVVRPGSGDARRGRRRSHRSARRPQPEPRRPGCGCWMSCMRTLVIFRSRERRGLPLTGTHCCCALPAEKIRCAPGFDLAGAVR